MKPEHNAFEVAGVNGCKAGWLVVIARVMNQAGSNCSFESKSIFVAGNFREVLSKTNNCDLICVDIPIGLKNESNGDRMCDKEARHHLGEPRRKSVFPPPIRPCLSVIDDYTEAIKVSLKHSGKKLTPPTFNITGKIRQVDDLMTPELQKRVREIHPEVSFWVLNGKQPIQHSKKTTPGQTERHRLLQKVIADMDGIFPQALTHGYGKDDALDALAAAWTAGQTVIGKGGTLPEKPKIDSKGLRMEILCPIR